MTKEQFHSLLIKYRKGLCTPEEVELIHSFDANLLKRKVNMNEDQIQDFEQRYLAAARAHVEKTRSITRPTAKARSFWIPLSVAASFALLISLSLLFLNTGEETAKPYDLLSDGTVVANNTKSTKRVTLPDGSTIELEPGAKVSYHGDFNDSKRELKLTGVAFFDISRDETRPFLIYSKDVVTRVLGTSFTIEARPEDQNVTVSVRTGKVSVYNSDDYQNKKGAREETTLIPNQKVIVDLQKKVTIKTLVDKPVPVKKIEQINKIRLDDASVNEVFEVLEELYGIDLVFDEDTFLGCKMKTTISEGELFNRLDIICNVIGATYSVEGTQISVQGSGCN